MPVEIGKISVKRTTEDELVQIMKRIMILVLFILSELKSVYLVNCSVI